EAVVAAKEDEREVLALGRSADIAAAAKAVGALRPDSFVTARRLLVLVARCGEAVEESDAAPATKQALHAAALALAGQAAFLSAMPDAEAVAGGARGRRPPPARRRSRLRDDRARQDLGPPARPAGEDRAAEGARRLGAGGGR